MNVPTSGWVISTSMASTAIRMSAAFFCCAPNLVTWIRVIPFWARLY